jgi:hypothetical protein
VYCQTALDDVLKSVRLIVTVSPGCASLLAPTKSIVILPSGAGVEPLFACSDTGTAIATAGKVHAAAVKPIHPFFINNTSNY